MPNESDAACTVGLRIQIPEEAALASLRTQPVPGWTATLTTSDLGDAARQPTGRRSAPTSRWSSSAPTDGGIGPGQFQEFALSGGPFPDADSLTFPTVQLYSDGSESAWIEPTVDGPGGAGAPGARAVPRRRRGRGPDRRATDAATDAAPHASDSDSPAGLALFLSILALLVAIGGAVLGLAGEPTYRVLVSSAVRSRLRPALVALFLSAGLVLSGCGGGDRRGRRAGTTTPTVPRAGRGAGGQLRRASTWPSPTAGRPSR